MSTKRYECKAGRDVAKKVLKVQMHGCASEWKSCSCRHSGRVVWQAVSHKRGRNKRRGKRRGECALSGYGQLGGLVRTDLVDQKSRLKLEL